MAKNKAAKTGILYYADGTEKVVTPQNGSDFQLHELYELLDVSTIEIVRMSYEDDKNDMIFVIDEEGKLVSDWQDYINPKATAIYQQVYGDNDVMVGNALYCKSSMVK